MSVVRINAITVPKERAKDIIERFANRAGEVSKMPGFEAFELLAPTDERDTFLVYTRWTTQEDFDAWLNSQAFQHGHKQHSTQGPVGHRERAVVVRPRARGAGGGARAVTQTDPVLAQLTGSGGPFEIVVEDILGVPTQVYKQRMTSLRELMDANARARRRGVPGPGRRALHVRRARPARPVARGPLVGARRRAR